MCQFYLDTLLTRSPEKNGLVILLYKSLGIRKLKDALGQSDLKVTVVKVELEVRS